VRWPKEGRDGGGYFVVIKKVKPLLARGDKIDTYHK